MTLSGHCATHIGLVRTNQEDTLLTDLDHNVVAVFDGMGGHDNGEVAAKMAADVFGEVFAFSRAATMKRMQEAFISANATIWNAGDGGSRRMGTTAVCLAFGSKRAYVGWSGDSRCYRLRDGALEQLTRDHSGGGHTILKCLGTGVPNFYEMEVFQPKRGDVYMLCTDGLHGMIPDALIGELLRDGGDSADRLVKAALEAGGVDNVTVVSVRYE